MTRIAEMVGAHDKSLSVALNRPGSLGFSIRADDKIASQIRPWRTSVMAVRDGVVVWSGPVATISGSLPDAKMNIGCVGWLELLQFRELRTAKTYGATNPATGLAWKDAEIAYDLLATVRAEVPGMAPPIYQGSATGTRYDRQMTWPAGTKVGDALRWLSDIEAGIDISLDPVSRNIDIKSWNGYTDRPKVHFGYNWGPHNVANMTWTEDGTAMRNRIAALSDSGTASVSEDLPSQAQYGLFEETISLTNVTQQDIVAAFAGAEVAVRGLPLRIYTLLPKNPSIDPQTGRSSVPRLFTDFDIGDRIRFSVNYGWLQAQALAVRAFGAQITIDDEGNEKISSLQTSP